MNNNEIKEVLRLHNIYLGIWRRCYNPSHQSYQDYGGRGIKLCDEWKNDESAFIKWAMSQNPEKGWHLDRMDNAQGYSPDNCRYVTPVVNNRNRRSTLYATAFGETKALGAWMEDSRCVVAYPTLRARLRANWDHEKAVTTPSTRTNNRSINV